MAQGLGRQRAQSKLISLAAVFANVGKNDADGWHDHWVQEVFPSPFLPNLGQWGFMLQEGDETGQMNANNHQPHPLAILWANNGPESHFWTLQDPKEEKTRHMIKLSRKEQKAEHVS